MIHFYAYRTVLFVLVVSLFFCASARAQTAKTVVFTTDGSMALATTSALAAEAAGPGTPLKLSQPPAPEATASFYDGSHKDLHQSLAWMQETNAIAPTYWNLYTEARIRLQLQDYAGARSTAEQAYQLALKAMPTSQAYVLLSAAVVAKTHELTRP